MQQFVLWWFGLGFEGAMLYLKLLSDLGYERPGLRAWVPASLGMSIAGPLGLLPFAIYLVSPITFGMIAQDAARAPRKRNRLHNALVFALPEVVLVTLSYVLVIEPLIGH